MRKMLFVVMVSLAVFSLTACGVSSDAFQDAVSLRDKAEADYNILKFQYDELAKENEELKQSNKEYEDIIAPYKDLSEAELLSKTSEANLQAKKDEKALEEITIKEAEEQAAKEKKEKEAREKEEKQGYNTGITFSQLARTPDDYETKKVKFTGKVIQVIEGDSSTQIRMAIDSDYDQVIYIEYLSAIVSSRVLDDDIITIYGTSQGLLSYKSTIGGTITIPSVLVDKIDQ